MARGDGGTMEPAFFPEDVEDKFKEIGFMKSKKGNYWKEYHDGYYNKEHISLRVVALCVKRGDSIGVKWYVVNIEEPEQKLNSDIALHVSMEFNTDLEQIHELIASHNE